MKKKFGIFLAIFIALLIGLGIFLYLKNTSPSTNENHYEANKTSATDTSNQIEENVSNTLAVNEVTQGITESQPASPPPPVEEQIATFSTKIYSNDPARQNNISITCNTLNGTIVQNGTTFSFCTTVGQASSSKGYQKADIFDKYGNKKKGLGGRKLPN